jgi:hypothetical protein
VLEQIVKLNDLWPVRLLDMSGLTMQGCDRCLQCERARSAAQCLFDEGQGLGNLLVIPALAILLFQQNQITNFIQTRFAPCIMQQHERDKCRYIRWRLGCHQQS